MHRAPLIGLLAAVVLSALFYLLLWQPREGDLEEVRAETAQLETQRAQLQNELRRLRDVQDRQVEYRAALARLEEYIPDGPAQSTVVTQMQATADAAGVEILSVTFSEPDALEGAPPTGEPGTVLGAIPMSMNVEGGYFQVVDFFRRIEVDVPRGVLVENVALAEGAEGFPVLNGVWSGQLFALVPDPALLDPAPPPPPADPNAPDAEDAPDADDAPAEDVDSDDLPQAAPAEES